MALYTIPGLLVSVLTILSIWHDKRTTDIEGLKRAFLFKFIISGLISILILLVELILLYFFYKDLEPRSFYNDIVLEYSSYLYLFIFIDVFLLLLYLPYFSNDTIKVEKYGDQYLIQSKSTSKNINVGIMYFVEKFRYTIGLRISTFLYRLLLFSSLLIWIIVVGSLVHNARLKDSNYPFVANEKIFVKNTKPIDIYEVKDNKIMKGTLPKDKVFSIAKGTEFSFDYEKLKNKERGGEPNIYNGVYGLLSSKKISIRKGSKLYFEEMGDFTIYVNDKSNELSEYYTAKTVPGKTYIQSDSSMNYEVIANPERNGEDTVYSFIVGYTKENIDYTQFLHNAMLLNGILMIISIIFILFTLWNYTYIFVLILLSIIPMSIIVTNGISCMMGIISGIICAIFLIEIINYMVFLRQNIFIKRLKSISEVSIEVLTKKPNIIFTDGKNKIDLKLEDNRCYYKKKYEYTSLQDNSQKLEDELRIISYKNVFNIWSKYFSDYNWFFKKSSHLFKLLTNSFNKDKSND